MKFKKRQDGRYEAKVTLGKDSTGKVLRKSIYANTIKDLEQKIYELKKEKEEGNIVISSNMLISNYCNAWYDSYKSQKETNTKAMYKNVIDKHINPCLGNLRVEQLKKQHIQQMINSRFDKARTCQQIILTLRQIINEMKSDHIINSVDADNLTKNLTMPRYKAVEKRALTDRELLAVKKADFDIKQRAFINVLFYFGLRREEALALMRSDFDFKENMLTVSRALIFDKNNAEIKDTKSYAGNRCINIPLEVKSFFIDYLQKLDGLYLFTKSDGNLMTLSAYRRMWEQIQKKMNAAVITEAEMQMKVTPITLTAHYFRHNYCTLLYYSGLSVGKAIELMGHADFKMIMQIYKHLDDQKEHTNEKINNNIKMSC